MYILFYYNFLCIILYLACCYGNGRNQLKWKEFNVNWCKLCHILSDIHIPFHITGYSWHTGTVSTVRCEQVYWNWNSKWFGKYWGCIILLFQLSACECSYMCVYMCVSLYTVQDAKYHSDVIKCKWSMECNVWALWVTWEINWVHFLKLQENLRF